MVVAIRVTATNITRVTDRMGIIRDNLPRQMGKATKDIANNYANHMRLEVMKQRLIWHGKLLKGIQTRRIRKNRTIVIIPKHGEYVDSMTPHPMILKKGTQLHDWAMTKGKPHIKKIAKREGFITVKPHPWIEKASAKARRTIRPILAMRAKLGVESR